MNARILTPFLILAFLLGACVNQGPKQTIGTLAGAAAGGYLGSKVGGGTGQLAATAAGVLLGAYLGGELGKTMDDVDRLKARQTTQNSLEKLQDNVTSNWSNPNTGYSGTVTPVRTYQEASGTYCREFQQTISVGGKTEQAYGTACRQPDGTWRIVQ